MEEQTARSLGSVATWIAFTFLISEHFLWHNDIVFICNMLILGSGLWTSTRYGR